MVRGQITLSIEVSEKGSIRIMDFKNDHLDVLPEDQDEMIKNLISKRVMDIDLSPPQNESGWPVKVNWRIPFNVVVIEGKLVLLMIN